ncbi:MAG: hypothetical protein ACR2FI_06640 [Burkholderiales bacterium]|nr:hypothetical protein [Burkholderiales bacterium]MDQ3194854.1 hypothetical protein [Pseudomonadota bacterium]
MTLSRFTRTALRMFSGPLIWGMHFLAIYVFAAIVCARRPFDPDWVAAVPWTILAMTLLAAAALLAMIVPAIRANGREDVSGFIAWTTAALAALALAAVIWETLPVLLVPICE